MRFAGGVIFYTNVTSSCVFLGLAGWLFCSAPTSSVFSTWLDKVVLSNNQTMTNSIATLNESLAGFCSKSSVPAAHTAPRLSIPPLVFSLNDSRIDGTVFATRTNTTYDSIFLLAMVIFISLGFQICRLAFLVDDHLIDQPISSGYSPCEALQRRCCLADYTDKPDFARWIEYALTAPLQIIIICSTVYIRNAQQLSLISALQGALTLCGWTVEMLISHLEISVNESGRFSQAFNAILAKFSVIFLAAVYMHYVIWSTILSFYYSHEANLRECDCGIEKLPPLLRDIVLLQCVLFSCFGIVPLVQVAYILIAHPDHMWRTWFCAALVYSALSIASKGLLALIFVKLITDGNCVDTQSGQVCLYQ